MFQILDEDFLVSPVFYFCDSFLLFESVKIMINVGLSKIRCYHKTTKVFSLIT